MKKITSGIALIPVLLIITLILTTCKNPFSTGLGEKVDLDVPTLEITSHRNGDAVGGILELTGTVTDDGEVSSVKISLDDFENLLGSATLDEEDWTFSYDASSLSDGDHEFIVKAADNTQKSVSLKILLTVDNNPPTVLVTSPESYGIDQEYNKKISIKGEASDTTRVRRVLISLYDSSDDTPVFEDAPATGTSSWYYIFDSSVLDDGSPLLGNYYFFVRAEDYSGNRNNYFYHYADIFDLAVDKGALPNIEEINAADYQDTPLESGVLSGDLSMVRHSMSPPEDRMQIRIDPDSDRPEFLLVSPASSADPADNILSSPQRFSGFVTDDDPAGIDPSTLLYSIYRIENLAGQVYSLVSGFENVPITNLSSTQWSFNTNLSDGEYYLSLYTEDYNGSVSIPMGNPTDAQPATFRVSSFAPVVTVSSPNQGSYVGIGSTTTVIVHVTGMGETGTVVLDPNGDGDYSDGISMSDQGGGDYSANITDGLGGFTVGNGEQTIMIRAGSSGNYGTASLQLTGDTDLPAVTVEVPESGSTVNGTINLAGTAGDTSLIRHVYLWLEEEADPATAPPADFTTWDIPDSSDLYNWQYELDTTALNAGNFTLHVKALDAAENESPDYSSGFTVDQESDRPVISLSNMTIGGTGLENGLGRDASIIGLVEDDDGVDASTVEVRIDLYDDGVFDGVDLTGDTDLLDANESEAWVAVSAAPGSDTRIASWSHSLINVPQGEHSMQIRVHDVVSDGVTNNLGNPNYAEIAETLFVIDYGPPDIVIDGPANGAVFNSTFSINGVASDANGVQDVAISFNGGVFSSVLVDPADAGSSPVDWNYDFTVESDGFTDGDYSYQIQATDVSGGKTTLDRQLVVDATSPTLTINQPAEAASVNGPTVTISGTASDNRSLAVIYRTIVAEGDTPSADLGTWEVATGTYSWSSVFDSLALNSTATAANYDVYLVAEDGAGNLSSEYTRTVSVDQFSDRPIIDFNDLNKDESLASNNVLLGAVNLTGSVEDDDLVDPASIEISLDGAAWQTVSGPPAEAKSTVRWSHNISSLSEGEHTVKIRALDNQYDATDGSDRGDSSTDYGVEPHSLDFNWAVEDGPAATGVPFILNIGPPNITIDEPANYSYHNTDVTISGTAVDANGVQTVSLSLDNGSTWIDPPVLSFDSGADPPSWSYTFVVDPGGDDDGTYSYMVRATDTYNSTGVENAQFTVDATSPTVEITQPEAGASLNGDVVFRGTAGDNIRVEDVYLSFRADGPVDDPVFPNDYTLLSGTYSWSWTLDTTAETDGVYEVFVVSMDSAGNISSPVQITFDIDQESDRPVIDITSLDESEDFSVNILPGSKQIGGTVTDDDNVQISTISYMLYEEDGTSPVTADWTQVNGSSGTTARFTSWTHSFGDEVSDGKYQVRFRAADTNDGGTWSSGGYGWDETELIQFTYDSANPVITVSSPDANGGYTNQNFDITWSATDAGGIKSLDIQFDGGSWENVYTGTGLTTEESYTYTYTVDSSAHNDDGLLQYVISATDTFNKVTTVERYLYVDTRAPETSIDIPSALEIINGLVTFRGEAADLEANGYTGLQDEVWLAVSLNTETPNYPDDYTLLSGVYNWSYPYNTFTGPADFVADGDYTLYVRAVDAAGNIGIDTTVDFEIYQESDRPELVFSTINSGESFTNNLLPESKQLAGTLEDDDGVDVSTIEYRLYDEVGTTELTSGWTQINGAPTGDRSFASWTQTFGVGIADGKYQVEFRAADTNDAGTWTTGGYGWVQSDRELISIDTAAPQVSFTEIVVDAAYEEGDETYTAEAGLLINRSFTVYGTVVESNDLSSLQISTDGTNYEAVDSGAVSSWYHEVPILIDGSDEGTLTVYVRATDEFGKITTTSLPVIIDTISPVITPTQPTDIVDTDPINVNGDVTLRGTITETSGIDSFEALGGTAGDVILNNTGSDLSWVLSFDSDAYASTSYGTEYTESRTDTRGNSYDASFYRFPVNMTTYDNAGNRGTAAYNVDIDPDSDRPLLYLTSPEADSSVAGAFIVQGTATDDDDIQLVRIQVDLNNDGTYTDADYDLSDDGDTPGDGDFENESVPVDITVSNGSWNILLNQNNEFSKATLENAGFADHSGWIGLRVTPVDVNSVEGIPVELSIYIDSTAPIISGQSGENPTPASGTTVRDTVNVLARFEDDTELSSSDMKVSYDGGVSYQTITTAGGSITENGVVDGYYQYDIDLEVDTTGAGGIVSEGNGILQLVLRVTDETFKQSSYSIQLNADNTLPTGVWNYNNSLTDYGGVYTFYGNPNDGGDYLLIGSAEDTGTISGVEKVDVFFVKSGNFLSPRNTDTLTTTGNTAAIADMSGTEQEIPLPPTGSYENYVISINTRSERAIYDDDTEFGDQDGFQESLRSKGTYDEWFVYFDTTVFPDGPLDMYYLVYDTAGNLSYELVDAQISNNPPSIDSIDIGGSPYSSEPIYVKVSGTVPIILNASDVEGVDATGYALSIADEYEIGGDGYPADTANTSFSAIEYDYTDFAIDTDPDTAELSINTTTLDNLWYRLVARVRDSDGNLVTKEFYLLIDNNDNTGPIVTIKPFDQGHAGDTGHIEESDDSPDGDGQADLSGTVTITGTARDGNTVNSVLLEISQDGGAFAEIGTATLSSNSDGDPLNGEEYTWSFSWDTASAVNGVDGVSDTDVVIRATGNDGTNDSATPPELTVDVVPYITEVQTGLDNTLLKPARRSVRGWYPVSVGQSITIVGYNLPTTGPDASNTLTIGGTEVSYTPDSGSGLAVALGTTDSSGQIVVTTNDVSSRNHLNDNTLDQNQENNAYNDSLTDDRYLAFFNLTSTPYSGIEAVMRPQKPGGTRNGSFDWFYVKNNVDVYYNANKIAYSFKVNGGDFTYNESGTPVYLFMNDSNSVDTITDQQYYFFGSVLWGLGGTAYGGATTGFYAMNWNVDDYPTLGVGNLSFNTATNYMSTTYTESVKMSRYENLRILTDGNDADMYNYVFYFDNHPDTRSIAYLSYRAGTTDTIGDDMGDYGGSTWYTELDQTMIQDSEFKYNNGKNKTGIETPEGRYNLTAGGADSSHFAPFLDGSGTMHLVYWDESVNKLYYIYNDTPYADPNTGNVSVPGVGTSIGWTSPVEIDSNAGLYPDLVVDDAGHVHIAYQDSANSTLKYAYLTSKADDTPDLCQVDGLFGAGTWNSITLKEDFDLNGDADYTDPGESENVQRPVITTYAGGLSGTNYAVKMAFPLADPGSVTDGFDPDTFTYSGDWEVMVVPSTTRPSANKTFAETGGTSFGTGRFVAGYNGTTLQSAELLAIE